MITEYRVHLDVFDGPMDLLMHLIHQHEVDISDIPVAIIADQYIDYIRHVEKVDMETAGDFLLMAATLMEIKSRMIARQSVAKEQSDEDVGQFDDDEGEDPRAELVRQLLAYRMYREAADALESKRDDWERKYPGGRVLPSAEALSELKEAEPELDLEDIDLLDLARAFARIAAAVNFDRLGEHEIGEDDSPIELHAADMRDSLTRYKAEGLAEVPLKMLLTGRKRSEMLGLFLAMLELMKQQLVRVELHDEFGIRLALHDHPQEIPDVESDSAEPTSA
ncbi:MAG: segregation/condensation protein A [Phycisphaeraceae bacterium]|nr:segregation/condensation protein A [Phycisphaerales bacterium]MCB9861179.1 segregation/condensation protein A [Phycisphaeraceae bacterium]